MNIDGWRKKIDLINGKLVRLLNDRARCAIEIGKIKKGKNLSIHDSARENHILEKVAAMNPGPLSQESVQRIFSIIIEENKKIEAECYHKS